jgi:plastocyanin
MVQTRMISINDQPGQDLAQFDPPSLPANPGDLIFWSNNTSAKHWPAPKDQPANTWFEAEIPGKLPGQPAPVSSEFSPDTVGKIVYVCALHPEEEGVIDVTGPQP